MLIFLTKAVIDLLSDNMKLSIYIEQQLKNFKLPYCFEDKQTIDRQKIIKRINYYKRDKFLECEDNEAIFYNIISTRVPHFKKNIIINIKELYPEGRGEYNQFQSWITKVRFRKWARDTFFSNDLDTLATHLTDYGECVLKISQTEDGKDILPCNLRMIHFDRTVEFQHSDKIEVHELTEMQIRKKSDVWNNIDDIIENGEVVNEDGVKKYRLYEFWGHYKEDDTAKLKFIHRIITGSGDKEIEVFDFKDAKEDKPIYYYFKLNEERIGLYERLFILQELTNKRVNQNDEAQAIASLLLLRSNDPNTKGNVLRDAISGQIVNSSDLEQIGIDNRALNGYLAELSIIEQQADKLCMTPEVITGQDMPSGTPFRSTAALINKAVKAFVSVRTNIAGTIIQMLEKEIFPFVVKNWDNEFLEIADNDNDIMEYDKRVSKYLLNDWVSQVRNNTGRFPSMEKIEEKKVLILQSFEDNGRRIFIDKGFFNWDYGFIYNATNEIEDRSQQNDVMTNLLNIKVNSPAMANDPLFRQMAEKNGVSAVKISQEQIQELMQSKEPGQPVKLKNTPDKLMSSIDSA